MSDSLAGQTIQGYEVRRELGRGGMGVVYEAYEPALDRKVALKVLAASLSQDPEFVTRFLREARACAKLIHPKIVTVHAVGEHEGTHFMALEYVDGWSLADLIDQRGAFDIKRALSCIRQAAKALVVAHEQDILHRDIKPGNIMIDKQGQAKLMDFGIAKALLSSTQSTATGVILGTPAYMSPEQCEGHKLTYASDIYSLGVTLYETLSGRPPFMADTPLAVIRMVVDSPVPPLQRNDISPRLADILRRMLAKDPRQRFESTQALVDALKLALMEEEAQPTPAASAFIAETELNLPSVPSANTPAEHYSMEPTEIASAVIPQAPAKNPYLKPPVLAAAIGLVVVLGAVGVWAGRMSSSSGGSEAREKEAVVEKATPAYDQAVLEHPPEVLLTAPSPNVRRETTERKRRNRGYVQPIQREQLQPTRDRILFDLACEDLGRRPSNDNDPGLVKFAGAFDSARRRYPFDTDAAIAEAARQLFIRWKDIYSVTLYTSLTELVKVTPRPHVPREGLPETEITRVHDAATTIDEKTQLAYATYRQEQQNAALMRQQAIRDNMNAARQRGQNFVDQQNAQRDAEAAQAASLRRRQQSDANRIKTEWPTGGH